MVTLKGILVHLLQNHEFDVSEKDDILLGQKEGQLVILGFADECTREYIDGFRDKVKTMGGTMIVASMKRPEPAIYDYAENHSVTIWDSQDIEKEIGSIIFDHVNSGGSSSLRFGEIIRAEIIDGRHSESGSFINIDDIGYDESVIIQAPKLHLDDVKEISQKTVKGFKYELELVPHFLFEYLAIYSGKGNIEKKFNGLLLVNAYTGIVTTGTGVPNLIDTIDIPHIKIEPKIDLDEATRVATSKVIEVNTEFDDVVIEKEHTVITEKTEFKPAEEDITMNLKGMIHVPVWCVEGTNGVMIINAATGKVVSEEYYSKKS
ncbi:MAG: hypothetical protein KAS67_07965 [Thermoplasmata archaeon]|nr:hypothetical protein [Thermoplasmata archaeon]